MKIRISLLNWVLVLAFLAFLSTATTPRAASASGPWFVATTGNDTNNCLTPSTPCASINGALYKPGFVNGDTVKLTVGTYTGTWNEVISLNRSATISGGWNTSFSSQTGISIVDGQSARRGVTVWSGFNAIIDHLQIQNGYDAQWGGGIYNAGTLTANFVTIQNNTANLLGGGLYNTGMTTLYSTTIDSNQTRDGGDYGAGGGIFNGGQVALYNSTVSNNVIHKANGGSGIDSRGGWGGFLSLNNSTVSGNLTGDGIYMGTAHASINSSTIVGNGGYGLNNDANYTSIQNSIVAGNGNEFREDCKDWYSYAPLTSLGYNLIKVNANCNLISTDQSGVDPKLAPLQLDGGPTATHATLFSSTAINRGNPGGCTDSANNILATDQRGFSRVGRCDIGAHEYQSEIYQTTIPLLNAPITAGYHTIMSEDFEGAFPGKWSVFDNNGFTEGEYYWWKRNCKPYEGSYGGWPIGGGFSGSTRGCGAGLPVNTDSWMVYGPFSLEGLIAADLRFKMWLDQPEGVYLCRMASIDGSNFYGNCSTGNGYGPTGWIDQVLNLTNVYTLGNLTGQSRVWIAIIFQDPYWGGSWEGSFVDNIVLRQCWFGCSSSNPKSLSTNTNIIETPTKLRRK